MSKSRFTKTFEKLRHKLGDKVSSDVSLSPYLTWRVGGIARVFALPETLSDLRIVFEEVKEAEIPYFVLGRGSNLLVADSGFDGIVIKLSGSFRKIVVDGLELRAGGAASLPALVHATTRRDLGDLTFAAGIPGSLGGAVTLNAGAFGKSVGETIKEVIIYNHKGELESFPASKISFGYRECSLAQQGIIVEATLKLNRADPIRIKSDLKRYFRNRSETQPLAYRSAGSVFKNPPDFFAGKLIEGTGCKGLKIGQAQVSSKHANFIINLGGASAESIYHLMVKVQKEVYEQKGIFLEPEVTILGQFEEPLVVRNKPEG